MKKQFVESQKRFEQLTEGRRKSCMWQAFPFQNFFLECWLMEDNSLSIFQIFSENNGFVEFKQVK